MQATTFTPLSAALGGALIGLAATVLMWGIGRISGISGIVRSVVSPGAEGRHWQSVFVAGLLVGAWLVYDLTPAHFIPRGGYPAALLVAGGLLVGYGTALGSGCTSGHGVCGLARFSLRSLAATLTFVAVGMVTAVLVSALTGGAI